MPFFHSYMQNIELVIKLDPLSSLRGIIDIRDEHFPKTEPELGLDFGRF